MGKTAKKVEIIRQIVELKQMMRRWRSLSLGGGGRGARRSGSDSEGSSRHVRAGFMAVYAGLERRRFLIPTRFVNFPVFASLLEWAEEEYGLPAAGGLEIPCDPAFFRWVIDALDRDEDRFKVLSLDAFLKLFSDAGGSASVSCKDSSCNSAVAPLISKTTA